MRRHSVRSAGDAWTSRGYHAIGAVTVRPSASTTVSDSSETDTSTAVAILRSGVEEIMPCLYQFLLVLVNNPFKPLA